MSTESNIKTAIALWDTLRQLHGDRVKRVENLIDPSIHTLSSFLIALQEADTNNWIANGKWGVVGNPYEQVSEDFGVLNEAAKKLLFAEEKSPA